MRRLWIYHSEINKISGNCEANTAIVNNSFCGDACAICRNKLTSVCDIQHYSRLYKCLQVTESQTPLVAEQAKVLLFTLLMLKNRQNTPFYALDYPIISKIFAFASSAMHENLGVECPIVKLPCRHMYHMHCLTLWRARRSICPICDFPILNMNIVTYNDERISGITISQMFVTSQSYDAWYAEKIANAYGIDANLVSILKHTPEGATLESLCEITARSTTFIIDKLAVLEKRGYVRYEPSQHLYYYN